MNCKQRFIEMLIENFKLTTVEATKVYNLYIKERILKVDGVNGSHKVTHGVFLEADVIQNAVNYTE